MVSQGHHAAPEVLFGWDPMIVSSAILILTYSFIVTEKINRAIISLLGAGIMIFIGVLNQEMAIKGVDFNTLALLIGMMAVVAVTRQSGVFEYVAIWSAKKVKGNPRHLMIALSIITAIFSALLDNVTTVMLIVPVTLLLCDQLKLPAYPFLFSQIFASNIGGTATLIGDPPNILIGSAVGLSFMDFVYNVCPAAFGIMVFIIVFFDLIWGRKLVASDDDRALLSEMDPREAIKDALLLKKSLFVLACILFGFIVGHDMGFQPGTIALFGAALLMLLDNMGKEPEKQSHNVHTTFGHVEWETIFFFVGLFIVVYGVETAGVLEAMAKEFLAMTKGDMFLTGMLIIWVSAVASAVVDNIPFVATMIPLIKAMAPGMGGDQAVMPLWWCLSLGACLGGNGSLVGASANLIVASFAERAGQRIAFMKFLKLGFPLMIMTIVLASIYAWAFIIPTDGAVTAMDSPPPIETPTEATTP